MRVPLPIKDFFAWRWAPCVALTSGSLAFVGLAVLLIPSQIDAARDASSASAFDRPATTSRAIYGASLAQGAALAQNTVAERVAPSEAPPPPRPRAQPVVPSVPAARGFSPVLDRPEPPPAAPESMPQPPIVPPPPPPVPADAMPAPPPAPPDPDAPHRE